MRKLTSYFLLLTSYFLYADYCIDPPDSTCSRCLKEYAVLYGAKPCLESCYNPCWQGNFTGSFLVWQALADGLEIAVDNAGEMINLDLNLRSKTRNFDFKWKPAFKAAVGIGFPCNDWNLLGEYTYYLSHMDTHVDASVFAGGAGLFPIWDIPGFFLTPIFKTADAHWKLKFNSADLSLGHSFFVSKHLSFRLHGGLKALFIDQRYNINYMSPNTGMLDQVLSLQFQFHNDARGGGPRIGVESKWYFPDDGGCILANIATSIALQQFRVSFHESDVVSSSPFLEMAKITHKFWLFRPCLETMLGYGWGFCFCRNNYFGMKFAYEAQLYWQQNMLYRLTEISNFGQGVPYQGDLILHGGTLTFEFNF